MLKRILTASATLAVALPGVASAEVVAHPASVGCRKTYTVWMSERAFRVTYAGRRDVTRRHARRLERYVRCLRNPLRRDTVIAYWQTQRQAWAQRRSVPLTPYSAEASWYDDAGETASGWHAYYGVANRSLPFGTHVLIRWGSRSVDAIVDDRGPYVYPREWDLNQNTAAALGFDGVGVVRTSVAPW